MATFTYTPHGVCARQISFDLVDGKLYGVSFLGGCNGNLKAIGTLLEGHSAKEAVRLLKGNDCNNRGTSCADQLAQAVEKALSENA
ncbi:TIGR03905 family TSCPD domain-containing protein [uncultured Ruminococcus sp.]|uniref:TIGR03905 family TSCPD domain-containing protein n=1 Tax=uncultured Ruminococcus sp. TaxID=165186 RepID=UPI0025F6BC54|nr:TIGR03905 family TSCPD domain-containing protein [uncultured Ruminococcus sp.]